MDLWYPKGPRAKKTPPKQPNTRSTWGFFLAVDRWPLSLAPLRPTGDLDGHDGCGVDRVSGGGAGLGEVQWGWLRGEGGAGVDGSGFFLFGRLCGSEYVQ